MKLEKCHIGQKVMVQYSSKDWYPDWQHDLGPHKIVGLSRNRDGSEWVVIDANGSYFDFMPEELEPFVAPNQDDFFQ